MRTVRLVLCTFVLSFTNLSLAGPTKDFHALLDVAWEWQLRESPMMASGLGDRRYNDQWSDDSIAAIERMRSPLDLILRGVWLSVRPETKTRG